MIPDQPLVDPPEERLDTALLLAVPGIGGTVAGHYYHARRELHEGPFHGHLMRVPVGHTKQLTEGQPAIEVINDDYFLVVVAVPPLPLHLIEFTSGVVSGPTALPATRRARDDDDFRFEVNLAEKLEPSGRSGGRSPYSESYYAGWIWCSGTSVKAVDFIHYDEKNNEWNLLQVKNRDNTENSSSSKIRDNTTIKKWFRTYSQRDATNWDNFPDEVSSKNLNEEDFRAFVKNYLAKII